MDRLTDALLVILVLTTFKLLASGRIGACVRAVATQGVVLGLLTLATHRGTLSLHVAAVACASMALKGLAFPWLLSRALREADVRREIEPYVGYTLSILSGLFVLGVSLWVGARLRLPSESFSTLALPTALFTILAGLFVVVARRTAVMQVLGFLVLENGIYSFGVWQVGDMPLLVELGVLLDLFVAVFVMGITIYHINREFEHIDTDRLDSLRG
jgi:hydrogenase-4 component E